VQPNSGSQANQAVLMAFAKPGDTIMGMSLAEGGHLTHGMPLNMSGKWFNVVSYGLERKGRDRLRQDGSAGPRAQAAIIIAGASAYSLRIDFERFAKVAKEVGAIFWVDMAHYAGLIAAGFYPNPVPHADVVTSTTHKTLRGPRGGIILMKAEHEKALNSAIFPGLQGGPLMHVIAAKAVAFKEAATPGIPQLPGTGDRQRPRHGARAGRRARPAHRFRPHRKPRFPGRPARQEHHRQGSRGGAGPRPHHGQQELDPERPAEALRHLRHPHRFAGDDHAWLHRDRSRAVAHLIADVLDAPER
jgi:hypothetical protein